MLPRPAFHHGHQGSELTSHAHVEGILWLSHPHLKSLYFKGFVSQPPTLWAYLRNITGSRIVFCVLMFKSLCRENLFLPQENPCFSCPGLLQPVPMPPSSFQRFQFAVLLVNAPSDQYLLNSSLLRNTTNSKAL